MKDMFLNAYYWHHLYLSSRFQARAATAARLSLRTLPCTSTADVAICILGLARTLDRPDVYGSIRRNVSASLGSCTRIQFFHLWHLEEGRALKDLMPALSALSPTDTWKAWGSPNAKPVQNLS